MDGLISTTQQGNNMFGTSVCLSVVREQIDQTGDLKEHVTPFFTFFTFNIFVQASGRILQECSLKI